MTGCLTSNPNVLFAAAIERLYDLQVGTTPVEEGTPHEKPHKPLLLLAASNSVTGPGDVDHLCQRRKAPRPDRRNTGTVEKETPTSPNPMKNGEIPKFKISH